MKRSTVLVFLFGLFLGAVAVPVRAVKRRKLCDITNVCCAPLQQMIHNSGVIFIYYILLFTSFYYSAILILSTFFSY